MPPVPMRGLHAVAAVDDLADPGVGLRLVAGAELQRTSVMRIEGSDARVEDGAVRFKVPERCPGLPFVVRAETYRLIVLGTRFGVAVNDERRVDVDVDEGVVEVWNGDVRLARLDPGQRWNSVRLPPTGADRRTGRQGDREAGAPADRAARQNAAPGSRAGDRPRAQGRGAPPPFAADPRQRARGDAGRAGARGRRDPERGPRGAGRGRCASRPGDLQEPRAEDGAGRRERLLRDWPHPERARAVRGGGRDVAPLPLRLSERHPARRGGLSIIETLAKAGDTDEALTEATDFLRRRPDNERRGEIARVAGNLDRARGDCRHAIGAYQVAQSASRARDVVEAATFYRAACLVRTGESNGIDAVRSYVRAYPEGRYRRQANELVEQATSKTSSH